MNCHVPDFQDGEQLHWLDVRADAALLESDQIDGVEFLTRAFVRLLSVSEAEIRALPREALEAVATRLRESIRAHAEGRRD